jgi:hypothetical protein
MTVVAFAVVRKSPATPTANHVRNAFTDLFIVSIMVRSVPELGTMAALPLPPNHSAFIGPFLGWKPAFALRLAVQLAALPGLQGGRRAWAVGDWAADMTELRGSTKRGGQVRAESLRVSARLCRQGCSVVGPTQPSPTPGRGDWRWEYRFAKTI